MLLDTMRRHSRSFIIYIFFGIIIAVFVVNFGPQSAGCVASSTHAGSIAGREVTLNDVNYAISVSGVRGRAVDDTQLAQLKAWAMDRFIARELLAREGERRGLRISDKEIQDMLLKGRYLALGMPQMLVRGENNKFDYDLFSRYVRYSWGISVKKFKAQQRRELLAERVRLALRAGIKVSEEEVQANYEHSGTRAQLSYVRFAPTDFRKDVELTPAKITAFAQANQAKVKKHYEANKTAYSKLPEQIQVSQLKISFDKAGGKDAALAKAATAAKRIADGEAFDKVARELSTDADSARSGGLLDWRNADKPSLGEAVDTAVKKLAVGAVSAVIEEKTDAVLVKLEGKRKGDLTLAQAQNEIARDMLLDSESKRLTKAAAESFIKRARAGAKLETLFASDDDGDKKDATKSPLKLRSTSLFPRSPYSLVPGIGISKDLMKAAFSLKKGEIAEQPFTIGSMIYLVALKDRKEASLGSWAKQKSSLIDRYQTRKADRALQQYGYQLCQRAAKDQQIKISAAIMDPPTPPGQQPIKSKTKKPAFAFTPCKTLKPSSMFGLDPRFSPQFR